MTRTERKKLRRHLENVVCNGVDLINSRTFDEHSWRDFHPDLNTVSEQAVGPANGLEWVPITKGLEKWLEFVKQRARKCDEFRIEVLETFCTKLNTDAGYASVMSTADVHGLWQGGVRRCVVMVSDFRREEDDVWLAVKQTSIPGVWS